MNTINRKANWVSRKAFTALVMLNGVQNSELRSNPEIYQSSGYQVGYGSYTTGISELTKMGMLKRSNKSVRFSNGFAPRTFKAVQCVMFESDYDYFIETIGELYKNGFSVENVAAIATVCFIDTLKETKENNGWFSLATYQKYLKAPSQHCRGIRTPSDAVGYVEVDFDAKMYRWKKKDNTEMYKKFCIVDTLIESYKPAHNTFI